MIWRSGVPIAQESCGAVVASVESIDADIESGVVILIASYQSEVGLTVTTAVVAGLET